MESKPSPANQIDNTLSLLIEPVWNRNFFALNQMYVHVPSLLIEPVWNRNIMTQNTGIFGQSPFNRTSMESKLEILALVGRLKMPFNRTSMESKRWRGFGQARRPALTFNRTSMESKHCPVALAVFVCLPFNRTSMESKHKSRQGRQRCTPTLLIEPVWNRNSVGDGGVRFNASLLIEPVWNRNDADKVSDRTSTETFNRTSMESKLFKLNTFAFLHTVIF